MRRSKPPGVAAAALGAAGLRQATALAALSPDDAAERLVLDWTAPLTRRRFGGTSGVSRKPSNTRSTGLALVLVERATGIEPA